MSYYSGPRIVTDKLSLCLDVTNPKSYPGSGTVWNDLCQGLVFNSTGTTTPLETISGARSFAFNGSGYWYCNSGFGNVDLGGDCTLIMWIYSEDVTVRKTIFEKAGTIYASYQQEIAVTWETSENFSYYSRQNPSYDYGLINAGNLNKWNMFGLKMSTGRTATSRTGFKSTNGSGWVSDYVSNSNTALTSAGEIRIGSGYAGTCDVGNVGMVLCYNKMLSDEEVIQNYNSTKTRFGL